MEILINRKRILNWSLVHHSGSYRGVNWKLLEKDGNVLWFDIINRKGDLIHNFGITDYDNRTPKEVFENFFILNEER
jgi:hypothetical protein